MADFSKFTWTGDLTLRYVEQFQQELVQKETLSDLVIEFHELERWDIAGIQFMYSLKRHYLIKDKELSFLFVGDSKQSDEWMKVLDTYL